jgi:hypothetical protein
MATTPSLDVYLYFFWPYTQERNCGLYGASVFNTVRNF